MRYKESYNVELKQEINADFKKEIITFANSESGEIYVGVDRNGNIVGVSDAEAVMEQISNMIRDGAKPNLSSYTSIGNVNKKRKIVIRVNVLRESDGITFDRLRCLNQELTFSYSSEYFAAANISFEDNNKRTLKLIDADGYFSNTALLLSDQCELVYNGRRITVKEFSPCQCIRLELIESYGTGILCCRTAQAIPYGKRGSK